MSKILVTGGAGYIGSFAVKALVEEGHDVYVYDSLELGHRDAVDKKARLIVGDLDDMKKLNSSLKNIDAVMHFAAYCYVGESVTNPGKYFKNNVLYALNLLDAMRNNNVKKIIFSSSCAVYGMPKKIPITEAEKTKPINPYGETKLVFEKMLDAQHLHGIRSISLRYFNAAGASLDGSIGEDHRPETHLIPKVLMAALKNSFIEVYGTNYKTEDGSCVRDYIHVLDLVKAHVSALDALEDGVMGVYNLGNGHGYSVLEIIEEARKITGRKIKIKKCPRRGGDPPILISSSKKIKKELGWQPENSYIKTILETAWKWHKSHPKGYRK